MTEKGRRGRWLGGRAGLQVGAEESLACARRGVFDQRKEKRPIEARGGQCHHRHAGCHSQMLEKKRLLGAVGKKGKRAAGAANLVQKLVAEAKRHHDAGVWVMLSRNVKKRENRPVG